MFTSGLSITFMFITWTGFSSTLPRTEKSSRTWTVNIIIKKTNNIKNPRVFMNQLRVCDLKNSKIRLSSKLSLGLIYDLSFQIQAASYFSHSWVKYSIWRIFMVGIGTFRVFMRTDSTLSLILHYHQPRSVLFSLGLTPKSSL